MNNSASQETSVRVRIIQSCRKMNAVGLNRGTTGNASVRLGDLVLITPSGVEYETLEPHDLAVMPLGAYGEWKGRLAPSSEWRFHLDIYRERLDIDAILHCHPTFATAIAMTRRDIQAAHYMIALAGGPTIRCAEYATYGTEELSHNVLCALGKRNACLLANHGLLTASTTIEKALTLAVEVEELSKQLAIAHAMGTPVILDDAEIERVMQKLTSYGQRAPVEAETSTTAGR